MGILTNTENVAAASFKKTARRKLSPLTSKAKPKKNAVTEILFDQEPTPFREPMPPYIWIDFPTPNEQLRAPDYAVRLGVGGATDVEIRVDRSAWKPCRCTSGYWWYDWSNIRKGKHSLVARMRTPEGRWFRTPARVCEYRT